MALVGISNSGGLTRADVQAVIQADVQAEVQAGIEAECGQFGSLTAALQPWGPPSFSGALTGATSHEIMAFEANKRAVIFGYQVSSDTDCTFTWWSDNNVAISGTHSIKAGTTVSVAPGAGKALKSNLEESIKLVVSSAVATLRVTRWSAYTDY